MTAVLFDTNIVIDYLAGRVEALLELEYFGDSAISLVSWIEVMTGVPPDLRPVVKEAISEAGLVILPVSDAIATETVSIRYQTINQRPKRRLKLPDAIIRATANVHARLLITRNTTDFFGADIRVPYQIDAAGNVFNALPQST
ncbi:PIN domain-containing protein [Pseudoduganella sp. FT25W]|uniref:PIN domain-containing protein n=1 Tax=Duganella alba TaxID=2666081 RepID=A0A6L5QNQ1_9BURK|nr:PIN domain-containing protein [Duganella alba]MRX11476.1 PIN domain-containing protein [Duganella alba]MRX19637.1 PIN domain-containing protein [Duganella alba]